MDSPVLAPRSLMGTPTALKSLGSSPPTPTPTITRPDVNQSSVEICLATKLGSLNASSKTPVPNLTLLVTVPKYVSIVMASITGL